ncbi:unnamed protein product, partial [Rotaria magnacalcarata]
MTERKNTNDVMTKEKSSYIEVLVKAIDDDKHDMDDECATSEDVS